jgi:DNA-binding CsgD family transcriptional regulator
MMSNICQYDKSTSAQIGFDMQSIAKPLQQYFNISMFGYMKIYRDNTQVSMSTHPHWLKCMYENFYHQGAYSITHSAHSESCHLWSQLKDKSLLPIMSTDFKMAHGITLIKKNEKTAEIFSFASRPENHGIVAWYLNNIDILEAFIHSFKEKGQLLLKKSEADRIILPKCISANQGDTYPCAEKNNYLRQSFFEEIKKKRLLITETPKKCYLTERELNCIARMIRGESIKRISKFINLSPRTVETYLNNAKLKLGAKNKIEMLLKIIKLAPHLIMDLENTVENHR